MSTFYIHTNEGPAPVEGREYIATIGSREARLFLHHESPLEGARLSCQRSGMLLGRVAPHLLARFVSTGAIESIGSEGEKRDNLGAALLIQSLVARHGAQRLWAVMDSAPSLKILEGAA